MAEKKGYLVLRLYRNDVEEILGKEDADRLSDLYLKLIARDVGDALMESGFWDILKEVAEDWLEFVQKGYKPGPTWAELAKETRGGS